MLDTLRMLRAAASEAGYAGRDRTATVLGLTSAAVFRTPSTGTDEGDDTLSRVLVLMADAFYDEGLFERVERTELFGPFDYDGGTAFSGWVAEQQQWANIRAGVVRRRQERISRN
jgi:hypothetical protein